MADEQDSSFAIHSSERCTSIEFFSLKKDQKGVVESFSVRVTDENLIAAVHVYADCAPHLTDYFEDLAKCWEGWEGYKEWASLERELVLSAANDRRGHITVVAVLNGGTYPHDWVAKGSIPTEAGLLDRIAADCRKFTGPKRSCQVD